MLVTTEQTHLYLVLPLLEVVAVVLLITTAVKVAAQVEVEVITMVPKVQEHLGKDTPEVEVPPTPIWVVAVAALAQLVITAVMQMVVTEEAR